jgi:hypothetical protein
MLRNIPEEGSFHLLRGGSIKSFLSYQVCKVHAPCFIVIRGLSGSFNFSPLISQKARLPERKKRLLNERLYWDFPYNFYLKRFSF